MKISKGKTISIIWLGMITLIFLTILIFLAYPLFVPQILLLFFGTSLILFYFLLKKKLIISVFILTLGFIALFFFFSFLAYPEKDSIELTFWSWDQSMNIGYAQLDLDFTNSCGDSPRGSVNLQVFVNQTINASTSLKISENIENYYLVVNRLGNPIFKSFSKPNSNKTQQIQIFNKTTLNVTDNYDILMNFTLKENVNPTSILRFNIYPSSYGRLQRVHTSLAFNTFEYDCTEGCILSNQPYTYIIPQTLPVGCSNFPYSLLNSLNIKSERTFLSTDSSLPTGENKNSDYLWTDINLKSKKWDLLANVTLAIIAGLIILLLTEIIKKLRRRSPSHSVDRNLISNKSRRAHSR